MSAYIDEGSGAFSLVWQGPQFADDVQVRLLGVQGMDFTGYPRSTTALDISFDNLDIIAEGIEECPRVACSKWIGAPRSNAWEA